MKDKLTISDLSPYLPYGLKVFRDCSNSLLYNDAVVEMDCIGYIDKVVTFKTGVDYYFDDPEIDFTIKPLLIPISEFGKWDEIFMKGLTACGWEEEIFSLAFEYHDEAVECLIYVND